MYKKRQNQLCPPINSCHRSNRHATFVSYHKRADSCELTGFFSETDLKGTSANDRFGLEQDHLDIFFKRNHVIILRTPYVLSMVV